MAITNAQLAQQVSELLDYWRTRDLQFAEWLSGTPTGGPYGDGRYPLTDYLGVVQYLYCPAALESGVTSSASSAAASAALAGASKDEALVAQAAAVAASSLADSYRAQAETARALALTYRNEAASHEANALTHRNKARDWSSKAVNSIVESGLYSAMHYATKASESITITETAQAAAEAARDLALAHADDAEESALDAAASALAAQTWKPANYLALAGGTMTGALAVGTGTSSASTIALRNNATTIGTELFTINNAVAGSHESTMIDLRRNNLSVGGLNITDTRMIARGNIWGFRGDVRSRGQGRFAGWYGASVASEDGLAVELGVQAGAAYAISYNRSAATYAALNIHGTAINFDADSPAPSGTNAFRVVSGRTEFRPNLWHTDTSGNQRFFFGLGSATYLRSPNTAGTAFNLVLSNGSQSDLFGVRGDGLITCKLGLRMSADGAGGATLSQLIDNVSNASFTYGSMYISGSRNGYHGLIVDDGGVRPTFMSNSVTAGIYNQGHSKWMWYVEFSTYHIHLEWPWL